MTVSVSFWGVPFPVIVVATGVILCSLTYVCSLLNNSATRFPDPDLDFASLSKKLDEVMTDLEGQEKRLLQWRLQALESSRSSPSSQTRLYAEVIVLHLCARVVSRRVVRVILKAVKEAIRLRQRQNVHSFSLQETKALQGFVGRVKAYMRSAELTVIQTDVDKKGNIQIANAADFSGVIAATDLVTSSEFLVGSVKNSPACGLKFVEALFGHRGRGGNSGMPPSSSSTSSERLEEVLEHLFFLLENAGSAVRTLLAKYKHLEVSDPNWTGLKQGLENCAKQCARGQEDIEGRVREVIACRGESGKEGFLSSPFYWTQLNKNRTAAALRPSLMSSLLPPTPVLDVFNASPGVAKEITKHLGLQGDAPLGAFRLESVSVWTRFALRRAALADAEARAVRGLGGTAAADGALFPVPDPRLPSPLTVHAMAQEVLMRGGAAAKSMDVSDPSVVEKKVNEALLFCEVPEEVSASLDIRQLVAGVEGGTRKEWTFSQSWGASLAAGDLASSLSGLTFFEGMPTGDQGQQPKAVLCCRVLLGRFVEFDLETLSQSGGTQGGGELRGFQRD